jgi:hypothetical protein
MIASVHRLAVMSALILVTAVVAVGSAYGAWTKNGAGVGFIRATAVGSGNAPALSKVGNSVKLTWAASSLTNGTTVSGYVVRRYNAVTGAEATVGSNCASITAALTCTETSVGRGSWQYTITPSRANWRGPESAKSSTIIL